MNTATILPWAGVIAGGLALASTNGVALWRIDAQAAEIKEMKENFSSSIDENEDLLEAIQRAIIERQGQVNERTVRIEIEQRQQGERLEEILRLLQQRSQ